MRNVSTDRSCSLIILLHSSAAQMFWHCGAFGTPGKMAAGIAITLQNIGAMSSYLYIVKSELPLVIQAFLKADPNSELMNLKIPCPFEEFTANTTHAHLGLNDSSLIHDYSNNLPHEDNDLHCTPRMFTINSQEMVFPSKSFNWLRHIGIAFILLTFINMLVIFAPNILGIFGIIG
ncbi:hypothetical protein GOODEAATRI_003996 [Goodea atripinnis]|uniref:Amino acid transporter transmembrane domain-containing protein n=1 Tax=Goodea atripinnis TaxID=208336 RepID=A0ABV0MQA8_9TELE